MSDNGMTTKGRQVTTAQLHEAILELAGRVQSLERQFEMLELSNDEHTRQIAKEVAKDEFRATIENVERIVTDIKSSSRATTDVFAQAISELTQLAHRVVALEGAQNELRRMMSDYQSAITGLRDTVRLVNENITSSYTLINNTVKARDAQLEEHSRALDELREAKDTAQRAYHDVQTDTNDLRHRVGSAFISVFGYDPANPETASHRIPNFNDRLQVVEKTTTALQADVEAVRVAVAGIDARFDAIGQTVNRILPPKLRRVAGNVWVLRAVAALLGLLGVSGASDVLNSLLTP